MDIKLNARLSAYSRVDSTEPVIDSVLDEQIDTLFDKNMDAVSVTKTEIDSLFVKTEDYAISVTKNDIDNLFKHLDDDHTSVTKKEIDSLFEAGPSAGVVSHSEIDSLFK